MVSKGVPESARTQHSLSSEGCVQSYFLLSASIDLLSLFALPALTFEGASKPTPAESYGKDAGVRL